MGKVTTISNYFIPDGTRVYAIGDIHGFNEHLARLHDQIHEDVARHPSQRVKIVYLGDYVSRGPNSKAVIDDLLHREAQVQDIDHVFLFGNHENGILEFLKDPLGENRSWHAWPDRKTLMSYDVDPDIEDAHKLVEAMQKNIPNAHIQFMQDCKLYEQEGDFIFVHGGFRPGVKLQEQAREDLFNTREPFMSHKDEHEYMIVHGHTSTDDFEVDIRPNRINLDTGLFKRGQLTCGVFERNEVRFIQEKY